MATCVKNLVWIMGVFLLFLCSCTCPRDLSAPRDVEGKGVAPEPAQTTGLTIIQRDLSTITVVYRLYADSGSMKTYNHDVGLEEMLEDVPFLPVKLRGFCGQAMLRSKTTDLDKTKSQWAVHEDWMSGAICFRVGRLLAVMAETSEDGRVTLTPGGTSVQFHLNESDSRAMRSIFLSLPYLTSAPSNAQG